MDTVETQNVSITTRFPGALLRARLVLLQFCEFPLQFPLNPSRSPTDSVVCILAVCSVTWCLLRRLFPAEKSCKVRARSFPRKGKFYVSKFTKSCSFKSISDLQRCHQIQHFSKQKLRLMTNRSHCYTVIATGTQLLGQPKYLINMPPLRYLQMRDLKEAPRHSCQPGSIPYLAAVKQVCK